MADIRRLVACAPELMFCKKRSAQVAQHRDGHIRGQTGADWQLFIAIMSCDQLQTAFTGRPGDPNTTSCISIRKAHIRQKKKRTH